MALLAPITDQLPVSIDKLLYGKLKNIKTIQKSGWDCCFIVCGDERSGKSTLGMTCAWILSDGTLTIENIAADTSDAISKLENLPNESVLIIDEGSLMFSSKDSMKREQRQLIKILNIIGQKRMILIICLPDFFDLNKYIVHRARFLLRTYTDKKLTRGRFLYWGNKKKNILFERGKKHFNSYAWPKSDFKSTFRNFNPLGDEYLKAKEKSLWAALKGDDKISNKLDKRVAQRNFLIKMVFEKKIISQQALEIAFIEHNCPLSQTEISRICRGEV